MAAVGTQLTTYTTAGAIQYVQSNNGLGINAAPPTNTVFGGITHFNNLAANNGLYSGVAGAEVPQFDKQDTFFYTVSSSATTVGIGIAPYQCTVAGYYMQQAAAPAVPGAFTVTAGSGTATYLTYTPASAGNAWDTFNLTLVGTQNTGGTATIAAGTPIVLNLAASGTAWQWGICVAMTRVGV